MRCHICDRPLNEGEIKFNKDHEEFDPCGVCLDVIENVFGEGEHLEESEIDNLLFDEDGEVIVEETETDYEQE